MKGTNGMADEALANAHSRRDRIAKERNELLARADDLARQLARVEQFISDYAAFASDIVPDEMPANSLYHLYSQNEVQRVKDAAPQRRRRNSKKEEVANAARAIVFERNAPIPRPELYEALVELGFVIEGTDPETVLSTMLWRTKDMPGLVHLRGIGYWPKEVSYDPAHYDPDFEEIIGVSESEPPPSSDDGDDE